jgi:diaminohydroxyphosphoribosylaminopyrimidine deaminase/5-amino-6-(5-phosphoribosylamino)uracil reductase
VTLKLATSRDGMVARARGQRDRVTGEAAQLDAHRLRAVNDAIVIGAETARIDRPRLDCRLLEAGVDREPAMVVFDTHLSLGRVPEWPASDRDYVIVCGETADAARARALESRGARLLRCNERDGMIDVGKSVTALASLGFSRLLVEGGPRLLQSFLDVDAWDAFWHYESPAEFGADGVGMGALPSGSLVDTLALGSDTRRRYVNVASWNKLIGGLNKREGQNVHGHR